MVLRSMKCFLIMLTVVSLPSHSESYASNGRLTAYPPSSEGYPVSYSVTIDFGWPTEDEPDIRLPCTEIHWGCWVGPAVTVDRGKGREYLPWISNNFERYDSGEMLSTVRKRWIARHGVYGTFEEFNWSNSSDDPFLHTALGCFQYWPVTAGLTQGAVGINLPGTHCGTLAPPNVTCGSLPSMIYDFGTVPAGNTSGLRQSQRQTLSCTNATSVTFRLSSDLKLSQNVSAHVSVNDRRVDTNGVTIPIRGNFTPLDFVVTTIGNEGNAGAYAASSVLIMDYR